MKTLLATGLFCFLGFGYSSSCISGFNNSQDQIETDSGAGTGDLWTREGSDWSSFLVSERNGKSPETGLRFNWSDEAPPIVWSQRVGEGYGIGSAAGGRYFHFDRVRNEARLTAWNAETGDELWQFTYPTTYTDIYGFDGGPRSSPVIDDDRVYIFGVEGVLHCLDVRDGNLIWKLDTTERFGVIQNFFGVGSSPLVYRDLLIVMVGGSPPESKEVPLGSLDQVQPAGSAIVAFDKLTGEIRYRTIDDLASYSSPTIAVLDDKTIGLALCRSGLFAFNPDDGEIAFEFPWRARKFESVNASTPVVLDSKILLTESYGLGGTLLQRDGEQVTAVWADAGLRDAALACHWNTPVIVDGYAYASSGEKRSTAKLNCVRLSDGKVMWSESGLSRSSLSAVDGHLICLTETGRLFALRPDPEKFEIVGEFPKDEPRRLTPCWAAPIISHGYLYFRDKSMVYCIDIRK